MGLLKEIWLYLRIRKRWWLAPLLIVLLLLGFLIMAAQAPVAAPFIYTLF